MVRRVELNHADAVAVREEGGDLLPEGLPVRLLRFGRIRDDVTVHQHDVIQGPEAVAAPGLLEYLARDAEKDDLAASAQVLHAGVGGQRRRQRRLPALPQQVLREPAQCLRDADLEVVVGGQCLGRGRDGPALKIIDHGVRTRAARINADAFHIRCLLYFMPHCLSQWGRAPLL